MLNLNQQTIAAYQQKMRAKIKEMKAHMQKLEARMDNAGADMRLSHQKNLDDWKSRFEEIDSKLSQLSESSGDAWEEVRTGIDKAAGDLQTAIRNAVEQLKD